MEAQEIIARIQSPQRLLSDDAAVWEVLSRQYPYFSLGHVFAAVKAKSKGKPVNAELGLHLLHPFQWVSFLKKLEEGDEAETAQGSLPISEAIEAEHIVDEPVITEPMVEAELPTTQPEEAPVVESFVEDDVLELIHSLPDSSAFDLNPIEKTMPKTEDKPAFEAKSKDSSQVPTPDTLDKSLMVMMSFTDWLGHFKKRTESEKEEEKEQKALKTAWQKEKLAAAADEEIDEIPEPIFKQAMDSISQEGDLVSEALAQILTRQGKRDKAIAMYKKLSLRNPEKSAYFANLIAELN